MRKPMIGWMVVMVALLLNACASSGPLGMDFVPGGKFDLSRYDKVMVDPVVVHFDETWAPVETGSHMQISEGRKEAVRAQVAELFNESFREELEADGNIEVVSQPGPGVLRITPVLVDVYLNAPLLPQERPNEIFVRTVGQVTLNAIFRDSQSGEQLMDLRDRVRGRDLGLMRTTSPGFHQYELMRIFEDWAQVIRQDLLRAP